MKFMTTLQRSHELGANATGMNMAKNQQVFLNLERQWGPQNTMEKLVDDKEITDQTHILENISEFYETLFKTQAQKTEKEMEIPKLSENQAKLLWGKFNQKRFIQFFGKYAKWQIPR